MNENWSWRVPGIPDSEFLRGKAPMTKEEVRAVVMCKLSVQKNDHIIDIGAGTGSFSIEASLLAPDGRVLAVESDPESCALIERNKTRFCTGRLEIREGVAPDCIATEGMFDKVIIGGSGKRLPDILEWVRTHLKKGGIAAVTAITLETAVLAARELGSKEYCHCDVTSLGVSKGRRVGASTMMLANNPITIVCATRS